MIKKYIPGCTIVVPWYPNTNKGHGYDNYEVLWYPQSDTIVSW